MMNFGKKMVALQEKIEKLDNELNAAEMAELSAEAELQTAYIDGGDLATLEEIAKTTTENRKNLEAQLMNALNDLSELYKLESNAKAVKEANKQNADNANVRSKRKAKFAKDDSVLVLRPSGIWAKRAKISAKESAQWMSLLMDMEDAHKPIKARVDLVTESVANARVEYEAWRKSLEPKFYFTSADKAYEVKRRRLNSAVASEFLGHPAQKSAMVFSDEFIAVADLLGEDFDTLAEQGCKAMFDGLDRWNKAISVIEDNLADSRDIVKALKDGDDVDMDIIRSLFRPEIRQQSMQLAELKVERRLIKRAIELARSCATPADAALIDARTGVSFKKAKAMKEVEGRTYAPLAKPEMKGYKFGAFDAEVIMPKDLKKLRIDLVKKSVEWEAKEKANEDGEVSDDEVKEARTNAIRAFNAMATTAQNMLQAGKPFEADSKRCQINDGRQSQLGDVIDVPYGKTTDMIISLNHDMANLLPPVVARAISDDIERASRNIDMLEQIILKIATKNGLTITYAAKEEGKSRKVHYKFWNANNSALKIGKCILLSDKAYDRAKECAQAGMTDEEFWQIPTNGSDMLKWWSYATTPSAPLEYDGKPVTTDDVLIVDSVEMKKTFQNVLEFDVNGNSVLKKSAVCNRTAYDGQLFFMVPIPSQQLRGGMAFKGYGVCCAYEDGTTIVDEIARREGLKIPELIRDVDGKMRRWRDYKVICTKDCWKWSGYGISYEEYCNRMRKLTEKYPTANMLYTARIADATEESKRKLTRQSTQQMLFGTDNQVDELVAKSVRKIQNLRTHEGIVRRLAGLDKPEDERTAFEHLIEVAPEILDNDLMKRYIEDVFNRDVAEAAVRPVVDGIYPYIAEDPVAFFKIVFWGMDPNQIGLGYLKANQVNIPEAGEGKEMYLVRYPNNYLCGMVAINHNDSIYDCVGNTMILSADGYFLIRADGDVDGDEMCAIFDKVVIDMMKCTIRLINPPLIVFPHQKLGKKVLATEDERATALAHAMVIANKFGPAVGQNSNLATKFMNKASKARMEVGYAIMNKDKKAESKARYKMNAMLSNAIIAHIAAIIAIDLAKTGEMPAWLSAKLEEIRKYAGSDMPWNQRFCKDSKSMPWYADAWNGETDDESESIVDRIARRVIDLTDARNYEAPTGSDFDYTSLLCDTTGLYKQGSRGKLEDSMLDTLDGRNFAKANSEGDNESALLERLHSDDPDDTVTFAELLRFLWRNQAKLVNRFRDGGGNDKLENAAAVSAYHDAVRDIMIRFGSFCGNKTFGALSPEAQRKSNVWHALEMAFGKNGIGNELRKQITDKTPADVKQLIEEEIMTKKASFAIFVVKVFAYDIYKMVCEKKGITHPWVKPVLVKQDEEEDRTETELVNEWTAGCKKSA